MKTYKVSVEKTMYCTDVIKIEASSPDEAEEIVANQILRNKLRPYDLDWPDELIYEAGSFQTTGDVE